MSELIISEEDYEEMVLAFLKKMLATLDDCVSEIVDEEERKKICYRFGSIFIKLIEHWVKVDGSEKKLFPFIGFTPDGVVSKLRFDQYTKFSLPSNTFSLEDCVERTIQLLFEENGKETDL